MIKTFKVAGRTIKLARYGRDPYGEVGYEKPNKLPPTKIVLTNRTPEEAKRYIEESMTRYCEINNCGDEIAEDSKSKYCIRHRQYHYNEES